METLVELLAGNVDHAVEFESRFDDVQEGQHPDAVTVSCCDSRVLQDHIWGTDQPGRVFTCSNIGNRVVQHTGDGLVVSGDVLYPIAHAGTDTAVVVGHTGCGAVTATYDALTEGVSDAPGIEHCIALLEPLLEDGLGKLPDEIDRAGAINRLVEYNVDRQVDQLQDSADVPEEVTLFGVVYDFQDVYSGKRGTIHVINVEGERSVERLRTEHDHIADRIHRLWEY